MYCVSTIDLVPEPSPVCTFTPRPKPSMVLRCHPPYESGPVVVCWP